jgi:phage terminase small subunit
VALNLQQAKFLKEYLKCGNATQAAIVAGYSEQTAYSQGQRLLKHAEIARAVKKALNKLEISAENVLAELAKLAFSNMGDYVEPNEAGTQLVPNFKNLSREQMACIQEIKVDETGGQGDGKRERVQRTTFKLADKGLNLERLGRHLKLFTDKIEVSAAEEIIRKLSEGRKRLSGKAGE